MAGIDLHKTLRDCLQAKDPIARGRSIAIKLKESAEPCITNLPMDK